MSTQTPAPPVPTQAGPGKPRRNWWLIGLASALVVMALVTTGTFAWMMQQRGCVKAENPTRSGAVGEYCPSEPLNPRGNTMTLGPDGNLWYVDGNNKIARFTLKSGAVTEFDAPTPPYAVADGGLVSGGDGYLWYHANGKLWRMSMSGQVTEVALPKDTGSAGIPVTGPDGNIWLPTWNEATQKSALLWIPTTGAGALVPVGVLKNVSSTNLTTYSGTAASDGSLWIPTTTESGGAVLFAGIMRVTPAGSVKQFSVPIPGPSPESFILKLMAKPGGVMWFVDGQGHGGQITPDGVTTYFRDFDMGRVTGSTAIGLGPDGNIWYSVQQQEYGEAKSMARITPSGVITTFPLSHTGNVSQITAGSDGGVWFVLSPPIAFQTFQSRFVRITP